ncbi:ImmA/IrrE family metallo-endopeptidase [Mesorhizobium mediterraneum]|uniref:ImmA/IrrE family metallo-endopeptidase n=1 Tax=Mesorhizobium mediterraneum TaxID=43617 RepID=UPI001AEE295D|nr:ImmA/IrrE family metallo-endopeptidase [Mesorhizobium mediterraneum]
MVQKVRAVVLEARDAGWNGPPFNPVALARQMGIRVEASAAVPDARTVVDAHGPRIEYNPQQRRARARFSIAHEIVHTFFPDVGDAVRNRGGDAGVHDDWQLELLCNLGASEIVMPVGSLPKLAEVPPLERLIDDRLQFDVSTEAYLIRVVSVTEAPVTMFIASPHPAGKGFEYRIDYAIASSSAPRLPLSERPIPYDSVVNQCTAIGSTAHGIEDWVGAEPTVVECVGIPGYPGSLLPRVAGILRHGSREHGDFLHFIHGNILAPRPLPPIVVCQLVNDRATRWGGGVAKQMAKRHPNAEAEFGEWIKSVPRSARLGKVHYATTAEGTTLASLVAQEGYGPGGAHIRYHALARCLANIDKFVFARNASVHMPRLGTGGAGAEWEIVESLIRQHFEGLAKGVWIYDLPPRQTQHDLGI